MKKGSGIARSCRPEVFSKKVFLKISQNSEETYDPSLPIYSGVSRITHSSPDLLNQEKFYRIFNILK